MTPEGDGGTVLLSPFSNVLRFGPLVRHSKSDCGWSQCIAIKYIRFLLRIQESKKPLDPFSYCFVFLRIKRQCCTAPPMLDKTNNRRCSSSCMSLFWVGQNCLSVPAPSDQHCYLCHCDGQRGLFPVGKVFGYP